MGGGEKDTEKAHKVRSQKGHCTAGITVTWYGRQQADTDRMWVFREITRPGIHHEP